MVNYPRLRTKLAMRGRAAKYVRKYGNLRSRQPIRNKKISKNAKAPTAAF